MPLAVESLDDTPVIDGVPDFSGGQFSNARANTLEKNQCARLINVDVGRDGKLTTRRGTTRLGSSVAGVGTFIQGLIYFDTPSASYLIAANGNELYSWDGANWTAISSGWTGGDANAFVQLVQGINTLYVSDGIGNIFSFDGTTWTDIGGATNAHPPAAPRSLVWHTNRLIASAIAAAPDSIYFSDILSPAAWNRTTQQIRVGGGEGDSIDGLLPWTDFNLAVFKRHSLWVVNCDPTLSVASFEIKPIHRRIGGYARTAAQVGDDIFFLSSEPAVRSLKRTIATETRQEIGDAISYPVQDIINRINRQYLNKAVAWYRDNRYLLAVPIDTSTVPNYVLVYNTLTNSWSGYWTGWTPVAFTERVVDSGPPRLTIGMSDGKVYDWLDYIQSNVEVEATFQDAGTAIPTEIKTRAFTCDDLISPKSGYWAEFEFTDSLADATVSQIIDDAAAASVFQGPFATYGEQIGLPINLPFSLGRSGIIRRKFSAMSLENFRELQFVVSSTAKKLSLRSIMLAAFQNAYALEA